MVNNLQYQLITEKIISQPPLRTGVILLKLRGLTSVYPDHAFAHYYLAKALSKLGELDQANNHHEIFRKIIHENAEWNRYASIFGLDGFDEGVDSECFVWPPTAPSS